MRILETERLRLIEYTYEMIQATISGVDELERATGYQVSRDWPGIDFFFYLPYVLENVKKNPEMTKWTRLVVLKEENKVIGEIGGQGDPDATGEIELGYSIVEAYQNRGYMTEALTEMIYWLKTEPVITRIFARCYNNNQASIQVLRHTGFSYLTEEDTHEIGGTIMMWELPKDEVKAHDDCALR
ncbi:GNAT family N-acetyltransferase [Listeria costaricensis]|uniref:GNAT family N-acetyltransferase n=1 Tax=Listeria costaricensis TaxID=2026604 RepID=UPI000C07E064|nr:GNAT family protein [Listeria costaricensis]